jgi:YebC/PmpR family DNA-binding regulatory protein
MITEKQEGTKPSYFFEFLYHRRFKTKELKMGRHATVAGRMASSAAAKGKIFTKLAREIMVSAKTGSDPNFNSKLRLAVDRAKDNNMPRDNIERAIKKGAGELEGIQFEEVMYEGYGPGGCAILVDCLTDNRNRTNPEIRRIFQKLSGNMGEMGSVAWMFKRKGAFDIAASEKINEEGLMTEALEAGADDVVENNGIYTIYTQVNDYAQVRQALVAKEFLFEKSGLEMVPETKIFLTGEIAKLAIELVEKLEDHDDCQAVFHNFDITPEEMAKLFP